MQVCSLPPLLKNPAPALKAALNLVAIKLGHTNVFAGIITIGTQQLKNAISNAKKVSELTQETPMAPVKKIAHKIMKLREKIVEDVQLTVHMTQLLEFVSAEVIWFGIMLMKETFVFPDPANPHPLHNLQKLKAPKSAPVQPPAQAPPPHNEEDDFHLYRYHH